VPATALIVEVTESRDLDRESIAQTLEAIQALGVRIAIDDFGSGYSSFGCLARLAVDFLKVDRKFVEAIATDQREATLGAAIVKLGASLGVTTVAEGIETGAQLAGLRDLGVPLGQGFLIDRPMPAAAFTERMLAGQTEQAQGSRAARVVDLRPGWARS
jgi:EAL domain-containing protein (putative c-di-GMP-specific phosphodiesterase class I)